MATKEVMYKELNDYNYNHSVYFDLIEVKRIDYLKWLESAETHEVLRKFHNFIHQKLMKWTEELKLIFKVMTVAQYRDWLVLSPNMPEVQAVKAILYDFKSCWKKRPKAPRRQ